MKRRFLKGGTSLAAAVCLAMSAPLGTLADMMPGYAIEKTDGGNETHNENIDADDRGILADNGSTVEQTGDVTSKREAVEARSGSTVDVAGNITMTDGKTGGNDQTENYAVSADASAVHVSGDVTSNAGGVQAHSGSNVTVDGKIESNGTGDNVSNAYSNGVLSVNSDIKVNKGVNVSGTDMVVTGVDALKGGNVTVAGGITAKATSKDSQVQTNGLAVADRNEKMNVSVTGDITASAEGVSGRENVDAYGVRSSLANADSTVLIAGNISSVAKDRNGDSDGDGAEAIGITAYGGERSAPITVTGNVTAKAESDKSEAAASAVQAAGATVIIKGNVSADAKSFGGGTENAVGIGYVWDEPVAIDTCVIVDGSVTSSGYGAAVLASTNQDNNVDFVVEKDLAGKEGVNVSMNFGTVNVLVDGTLSGETAAIHTIGFDSKLMKAITGGETTEEGKLNVTVWKLKSGKDLVKAEKITAFDPETGKKTLESDAEKAAGTLKNVNYIIHTDEVENGVIKLSGTKQVSGANGKKYDTAKEDQEVIIRVETAEGYQLDAVKNGNSVLKKNSDGSYTLIVPRGGGIQLSAVLSAIRQTENGGDSDDGGNPPAGYGETKGNAATIENESGAKVTRTVTEEAGNKTVYAQIEIGGKTAAVESKTTTENGQIRELRTVSGDIAGVSFKGVGTVSADGKAVTLEDGRTFAVISAPSLMITENGVTRGYFLNADGTGPLATGKNEVYYCLGADGQLHAHWVDPNGFFYTGTVQIDGQTYTFNEQGELLSAA